MGISFNFLGQSKPSRADLLNKIDGKATDEELETIAKLLDHPTLRSKALNKARKLLK